MSDQPANDAEAERYLIGAALSGYPRLDDLADKIAPEDFYSPVHEHIWAAIVRVHQSGTRPEPVAVRNAIPDGVRGFDAIQLVDYSQQVPVIGQAPYYADQVARTAGLRRIQQAGAKVQQIGASAADLAVAREDARAAVDEAVRGRNAHARVTFADAYAEVLDVAQNGRGPSLSTPWRAVDDVIGGLAPGRLIIVGARPGVGKSLAGTNLALHMAYTHNHPVLISSMEMSHTEVGQRLLAAHASVHVGDLQEGRTDAGDWRRIQATDTLTLADLITIDDAAGQTLTHIRRVARDIKRDRDDLALIVVDYLQLMTASSGGSRDRNRVGELTEISRGLKTLAREMGVCVVAMAQLSREATKHSDGKPKLTDLRESGSIENDADQVILMHFNEEDDGADLHMLVAKNRHGRRGVSVTLLRRYHYAQIVDSDWTPR